MTNKEKVEIFKNEKIAVNCETEEEAKEFVKWCCANGFRWDDQPEYVSRLGWYGSPEDTTFFNYHKAETCYCFAFKFVACLGYGCKCFYEKEGYKIINFKDFMKEEKRMTNLEVAVSKDLINIGTMLCVGAHICKYGGKCRDKECYECEFYKDINLCVQTLLEEYKEPIKLKQWEYDLIMIEIDRYGCGANTFGLVSILKEFKEKGCFKGVYDVSMTLQEILDNCEVVE